MLINPLFLKYIHFLRIKGCPLSACSLLKVHDRLLLVHLLPTAATSTLSARNAPNTAATRQCRNNASSGQTFTGKSYLFLCSNKISNRERTLEVRYLQTAFFFFFFCVWWWVVVREGWAFGVVIAFVLREMVLQHLF